MSEPAAVPGQVRQLAEQRLAARQDRNFAAADELRGQIRDLGWTVADAAGGYLLTPDPGRTGGDPETPYQVLASLAGLARPASGDGRTATIALLVEGWPQDLRDCVSALLAYAPPGVRITGLDIGNVAGAGAALHQLAAAHPGRIDEHHVGAGAGWGPARNALLEADPGPVHILMETSTILTGDAITPLLAALAADGVVAAGWRGADPDPGRQGFHEAGPGPVRALLGYLLAVRTDAARRAGGLPARARFYRNADLEFSLRLGRAGTLLVPPGDLPVRQARHRGYDDSDPQYREAESRRNYRRVLDLLRAEGDEPVPAEPGREALQPVSREEIAWQRLTSRNGSGAARPRPDSDDSARSRRGSPRPPAGAAGLRPATGVS